MAPGTAAGSLTPTISQRRVKSSIAVNSGQTVLLAGLISETENKQRQGIPLLDSIPGVGDAFSHQNNSRARTELILFIRPTLIKDAVDAHVIAEEMRSKMNSRLVGTSLPVVVVDPPKRHALSADPQANPCSRSCWPRWPAPASLPRPALEGLSGALLAALMLAIAVIDQPLHHSERIDGGGARAGAAARRHVRTGGGLARRALGGVAGRGHRLAAFWR